MVLAAFLWSIYAASSAPLTPPEQSLPPIHNFDDGADQDPFYDLLEPESSTTEKIPTPSPTWEEI